MIDFRAWTSAPEESQPDCDVSTGEAFVRSTVIHTREDLQMASEARQVINPI